MKKTIITVSRRTDIPAYYADWFRARLEKGYAVYPNPYSQKPVKIDLLPENVKAFVFWTRNPHPLFKHLDYIDSRYNYHHYMHLTINGLPELIEKRNPTLDYAISSAEYLAKRYGINYLQWRFDPIVLSSITDTDYILNTFEQIANRLADITSRCYFSFVDLYEKTKRNFIKTENENNINFYPTSISEQVKLIEELQIIAERYKIDLYACAEDQVLELIPKIKKAHCVDSDIVNSLYEKESAGDYKLSPSRLGCGCIDSQDLGYYDSCPHGCIYCYANMDPEKALLNARQYLQEGFPLDNIDFPAAKSIPNLFD